MTGWGERVARGVAIVGFAPCIAVADIHVGQSPKAFDARFLDSAGYIEAGPLHLLPSLGVGYGYDDNIFESRQHVRSSPVATIVPELSALWQQSSGALQFGYRATVIQYIDSDDDDFTGQMLFGRGRLEAGYRNRFSLDLVAEQKNEPRGTGLTIGIDPESPDMPDSPDEFTDNSGSLVYEFGARGAEGMLRFHGRGLEHEYSNHRDRTRYFDRDEAQFGGAFLWRLLPRSTAVLELRSKQIRYAHERPGASTLDSDESDLLLGAEWDVTETTTGSARVGRNSKNFDADDRTDEETTAWEVSATWTPINYSTFRFRFERMPQETSGIGDFVDTRTAELVWEQRWRDRLGTRLRYKNLDEQYKNAGDRSQKTDEIQLDLNYAMRRWLTWTVTAIVRDRSSDTAALEFDRNVYQLGVELHL